MRKARLAFILGCLSCYAWGQPAGSLDSVPSPSGVQPKLDTPAIEQASASINLATRTLLAMTSPEYPATPGDVYSLSFSLGAQVSVVDVMVHGDGVVYLGVLGSMASGGQRFQDLKTQIEKRVAAAYPGSSPSLVIKSVGAFSVRLVGEVEIAGEREAWGLSRLSEAFEKARIDSSSDRIVSIRTVDGVERSYDLFRALRFGDRSQDPLLRPGDTIMLSRASRTLKISGAVYRPGLYELLPGENLHDALSMLGGGLRELARSDLAVLSSPPGKTDQAGSRRFVDLSSATLPEPRHGDELYVPSRSEYAPVVYFEGALQADKELASQYGTDRVVYFPGDRLSRALREVAPRLSPQADLRRAFLSRRGQAETIPVDLERLLFAYDPSLDLELKAEDRIVIPLGSLDVFVTGEVLSSRWVNVQALSRLSATIKPLLTRYASVRDVLIRGEDGTERRYDLFRAERYGELAQDPYLRPGDRVIVGRVAALATVGGEVRRPGTYQLLPGEGLKELIEVYADGFTELANPQRISLVRRLSEGAGVGEKSYVDYRSSLGFSVRLYDAFSVPPMTEYLPVAWFEGALGVGVNGEDPQAAKRFPYTFYPGELLSQAVQAQRKQFSAVSDLERAYVKRGTERIAVDLSKFLYAKDFSGDLALAAGDEVIVPFRQFFVSVSGAVKLPGRYPYVPDRDWRYYVRLAGGFDTDRNAGEKVDVRDQQGRRVAGDGRAVQPEDSIEAASNDALYGFGKVAGILTTVISIASLVISLLR